MTLGNQDLDLDEIPNPNEVLAPFFRAFAVVLSGSVFFSISWLSLGNLVASVIGAISTSGLTFAALYLPQEEFKRALGKSAYTVFVGLPICLVCFLVLQVTISVVSFLLANPCLGAGLVFLVFLMILAIAAANLAGPGNRSADKTPQLSVEVQSQDSQSSRYTISQRRSVWERSNKVCNQCQTPLADWRGENMRIKEVESKKDRDTVQLIGICPNCDEGPCDVEENAPSKVDEKNYRKKWSLKIREKVWKRNKERCYYCHKHLVSFRGEHMHLDHLVPFSRGGADHEDNLVPACPKCNLEKSDAEFPELR